MGALYKIEFENGKVYFGITSFTAEKRFSEHEKKSNRKKHNSPLYDAMRKHRSRYRLVTIAVCDNWEALALMEVNAIRVYGTLHPAGYNMTLGGDGTPGLPGPFAGKSRPPFSEEWKRTISLAFMGNQRARGLKHTAESKAKMGQPGNQHAKGKTWTLTEEQRSHYGKRTWSNADRGKIACIKATAGALKDGRPVSLWPRRNQEFT